MSDQGTESSYHQRLIVLHKISQSIVSAQSPQQIGDAVVSNIRMLVPCQRASVVEFDPSMRVATLLSLSVSGTTASVPGRCADAAEFEIDALKQGQVAVVTDLADLQDLKPIRLMLLRDGIRSIINVPISCRSVLIGSLNLGASEVNAFTSEHVEIARELAALLAVAMERTRRERQLQESEENYRTIFDAVNDSVVVHDSLTGEILDANKRACELFGGTLEQVKAQTPQSGTAGDPAQAARRAGEFMRQAAAGESPVFEWQAKKFNGETVWVEVALRRAVIGGNDRVLAVVRDISDRKAAQNALQAERDFANNIIETAQALVIVVDPRGRIVRFNKFAQHVTGYEEREVLGQLAWDHLPSERREGSRQALEQVMSGQCLYAREGLLLTKDRRHLVIRWYAAPLRNVEGDVVAVLAIGHDVTERIEAAEALRAQRDFVHNLIQTAQALVIVLTPEGKIVQSNRFADEITGISDEQSRGWDAFDSFIPQAHRETGRSLMAELIDKQEIHGRELPLIGKGGKELIISWSGALLRDAQGEVSGILVTGHDVTELRQKEEQLRQAQKMEAIGRLAGGIAHDFNNQLTIIKGYCELLMRRGDLDLQFRSDLNEIQTAANRSARMISELLTFSRKQVLRPRRLNLGRMLKGMMASLRLLVASSIDIKLATGPDVGSVYVDPVQMQQAIINLASNASDAMPHGGRLSFELANTQMPDNSGASVAHVLLSVSDTGAGIDPEVLPRVFEPFFTTKPVGHGTGLGLPMVYGLVKQSGGQVLIDSTPGRGTTLRIYLPRYRDKAKQPSAQEA